MEREMRSWQPSSIQARPRAGARPLRFRQFSGDWAPFQGERPLRGPSTTRGRLLGLYIACGQGLTRRVIAQARSLGIRRIVDVPDRDDAAWEEVIDPAIEKLSAASARRPIYGSALPNLLVTQIGRRVTDLGRMQRREHARQADAGRLSFGGNGPDPQEAFPPARDEHLEGLPDALAERAILARQQQIRAELRSALVKAARAGGGLLPKAQLDGLVLSRRNGRARSMTARERTAAKNARATLWPVVSRHLGCSLAAELEGSDIDWSKERAARLDHLLDWMSFEDDTELIGLLAKPQQDMSVRCER